MDSEAPDIMLICSMVDYSTHAYIEAVRYIFISKICFCVLMVQIADLCCEVKIKNDIFVSLVGMFSESDVSIITTILGVSFYYKAISVSVTSVCFFFRITEFISRMQAFNVSNYFSHSYVPLTRLKHTCGVKVKKTQLSENIFAYLFGDSS